MRNAASLALMAAAWGGACSLPEEPSPEQRGLGSIEGKAAQQSPPKKYTLALGNSIAFGLQPGKGATNAAAFNSGPATLFVARLNATTHRRHVSEVNLACPGETTETFLSGACLWTADFGLPLHRSYRGSQLAAAERFLRRHRGQVNPIVLSLGANEVLLPYLFECDFDESCVAAGIPRAIEQATANYEEILDRLRTLAPHATILILVEYRIPGFPAVVNAGLAAIYDKVRAAGRAHGAVLVETDPLIRSDPCGFTFMCTEGDFHPTDRGYDAFAQALWAASGFGE